MNLNDLFRLADVDPSKVLVMRYSPSEPLLKKALPWFAEEKPDVFNAYQQTQGEKVEKAMLGAEYVASFLSHGVQELCLRAPIASVSHNLLDLCRVLEGACLPTDEEVRYDRALRRPNALLVSGSR